MTAAMDPAEQPERFPRTSRYHGLPRAIHTSPDGREIPYTPRRLLPDPATLTEVDSHVVDGRDRVDLLADRYLGDPEQWWRIADANPAARPSDLTEQPGRRLRITLPAGLGGAVGQP
jgi:hypothetical protein